MPALEIELKMLQIGALQLRCYAEFGDALRLVLAIRSLLPQGCTLEVKDISDKFGTGGGH